MSKITPSSLYYMADLRHKLLCIDESHGSEGSLYPLRTLQSNHKLVLACPVKDAATGSTITKQLLVKGPVSFIESTTSDSLHPENASRAIILKMDESPEQTKRILKSQRDSAKRGFQDKREAICQKWQDVSRTLSKYALAVTIPFADELEFPVGPNARRDNMKLLSLIKAITLLNRFHRQPKEDSEGQYIEATVEDYQTAYDLFVPLMKNPEDDLSQRARTFLKLLNGRTTAFTRREIMEEHKLSKTHLWRVVQELQEHEIIAEEPNAQSQAKSFVLLNTYIPENICRGLTKPELIQADPALIQGGLDQVSQVVA